MGLFSTLGSLYQLAVDGTKEVFIRILMGILIFLGYVLLSLFIYAVMRRIMVPQKLHDIPVHLQYNPMCVSGSNPSCPFPQAEVVLNGGKKLLSSGQYYAIALEMEVPESKVNQEIGVFMVNLTFYTKDNQFLSTSARPAMVHYKSFLYQTIYTLFFALPLLFGFWEQKQLIDLPLYENYYEPYGDGALTAKVTLQNHLVQVYSSSLTIEANFSGFTYYLYQWPISMSVIVVISIFITLCTCTVLMWVRDVLRDFDLQRRRGLQRRRMMQQQQQRAQQGGGQQPPRHTQVSQRAPTSVRASPPTDESRDTLTGVEDIRSDGETTTPSVTPAHTRESSVPKDTDSDISLNTVINTLQSLRQEIGGNDQSTAETSSVDGSESGAAADGSRGDGRLHSQQIRHRTGH